MPNQPSLNPDALESAFYAVEHPAVTRDDMEDIVSDAVRAYLAVAQPEVNSVEELDALPLGTSFVEKGSVFIYQILSNGEQGKEARMILSVGIEEEYDPEELDFPLTVISPPVEGQ